MKKVKDIWISAGAAIVAALIGAFAYQANQSTVVKNSPGAAVTQIGEQKFNNQGDNSKQFVTTGNQSPITYVENQTTNYYEFIQQEAEKSDPNQVVDEKTVTEFFRRFQFALINEQKELEKQGVSPVLGFLRTPYDINVLVSNSHGVGYEFVTPSPVPEVNVSFTSMPIEKYYFSKYTNDLDYSNARIFRVPAKQFGLIDLKLIGGKDMVAVENSGDVLLVGIAISYSGTDDSKEISFLRMFGSNQKKFWEVLSPEEEAKYLVEVLTNYHQFNNQ